MTVQLDLAEGTTINHTPNGYSVERIALVSGVNGVPEERIYNAVNDAGIPSLGDAHPIIPGVYLTNKRGDVLDPETVRVTLNYTDEPGYPLSSNIKKTVSATTTPQPVKQDKDGADMWALYQTLSDVAQNPPVATKESLITNVETTMASIEFEWTIDDGTGSTPFPQYLIDNNLGHVNSSIWNGYPARSILCSAVSIAQQGQGFRVSASFSYNPRLWEYNALIAVPLNQLEPTYTADPTLNYSTGVKNFLVYPEADFTPLALTL